MRMCLCTNTILSGHPTLPSHPPHSPCHMTAARSNLGPAHSLGRLEDRRGRGALRLNRPIVPSLQQGELPLSSPFSVSAPPTERPVTRRPTLTWRPSHYQTDRTPTAPASVGITLCIGRTIAAVATTAVTVRARHVHSTL